MRAYSLLKYFTGEEQYMKNVIYYYTGTGNSLWTARAIADKIGQCEVRPMVDVKENVHADGQIVGLVFPVYIWGVSAPVLRFIEKLKGCNPAYLFAVALNAGQVSNTLVQLRRALAMDGLTLASGFSIAMPSNYIVWGGPGSAEKQQKLFDAAEQKVDQIASAVKEKRLLPVEKGSWWQRIFLSLIYSASFKQVPSFDKKFFTDEKCNGCSTCERVCPAKNIVMTDSRPVWKHHCDQCFACVQWCPQEAIQCNKKTAGFKRYHHPQIKLSDMLRKKKFFSGIARRCR
jgi:Na+-translocating ferredoxin:NAD+ oxidoreductase RNF subunit RnfB